MNKKHITILSMLFSITFVHYYLFSNRLVFHDLVSILYYIPIIYGAFVFKLKGGVVVSSLVVILFAPHLLMYFGKVNLEVVYQLLELIMFVAAGLGVGYLMEKDDIKRKAIEKQVIRITDLENYNHNILDSIDSGIVAFDNQAQLKFINEKAKEEFNNIKGIEAILKNNYLNDHIMDILKGSKESISKEMEYKDQYYQLNCMPIVTINKDIEGVVVIIKNITMVKTLEEQVRRGERLAAVGNLAAGIAHEIRNPLGIIKTISQTLVSDQKPEIDNLKEGLEIIDHEINRANDVVKWLMDFAKPDQYLNTPVNLSELMNQLAVIFNKYSERKSMEIILDIKDDVWTFGDTEKLKQAFVNLMLNGIQAAEGMGRIEITVIAEGSNCIVTIKDDGCGIPADVLDKVFNPFFTTKEKGTGLGLSITHKIIERHDGKLKIQSEQGEGTMVTVYLPMYGGEIHE